MKSLREVPFTEHRSFCEKQGTELQNCPGASNLIFRPKKSTIQPNKQKRNVEGDRDKKLAH
jgi:hypothetical protein